MILSLRILISSFETIAILALSVYTLKFVCYRSKPWNSGPVFIHIGILTSSFETLTSGAILINIVEYVVLGLLLQLLELWPYPFKGSYSGLIFIPIGILILSFQTLEFWPYFYTHWFSDVILHNLGILALFLKALEL